MKDLDAIGESDNYLLTIMAFNPKMFLLIAFVLGYCAADSLSPCEVLSYGPLEYGCELSYTLESENESMMNVYLVDAENLEYMTSDCGTPKRYYPDCSCLNSLHCDVTCHTLFKDSDTEYYVAITTSNLVMDAEFSFDIQRQCSLDALIITVIVLSSVFGCCCLICCCVGCSGCILYRFKKTTSKAYSADLQVESDVEML